MKSLFHRSVIVDINLCRALSVQYTPPQQQKWNITTKHKEQFVCPKGSNKSSSFFRNFGDTVKFVAGSNLVYCIITCIFVGYLNCSISNYIHINTQNAHSFQIKCKLNMLFKNVLFGVCSKNVKNCNVPTIWNFPLILYAFSSLSTNN